MTTVVHVKTVLDRLKAGDPDIVYIGRENKRYGLGMNVFQNPYPIKPPSATHPLTREESIDLYRDHVLRTITRSPYFQKKVAGLKGKTLACWCAPLACHGDILAELADAL